MASESFLRARMKVGRDKSYPYCGRKISFNCASAAFCKSFLGGLPCALGGIPCGGQSARMIGSARSCCQPLLGALDLVFFIHGGGIKPSRIAMARAIILRALSAWACSARICSHNSGGIGTDTIRPSASYSAPSSGGGNDVTMRPSASYAIPSDNFAPSSAFLPVVRPAFLAMLNYPAPAETHCPPPPPHRPATLRGSGHRPRC